MADFWGGVAKGFGPSYDTASARRIRAEERAEDRKYADDIRDKQWKRQVEERMKLWDREDAQLRIKMAHELQKLEDAERRGDVKKVEAAKVIIQSLDREIREKVQPKAPPLLGGPAMGVGVPGAGQPPRAIPRDIDAAMPSVLPGEIPRRVSPAAAPVRPPERVAGGLPVPKEFEGSPDMMESIRKSLSEEKGEVSDAAILGAAVKGQRMQTLAEDLKKEDQKHEIKGKRAFEYLKDIKTADSPPHNFLSKFDAGREWIDAVMNMELEEGGRNPRISVPTAIQFADMIKASVSEFSKPTKTTAPTLHARAEELVKIINNPDSTPPEKAEAQKILDVLKPPATGRAPTTIEKREEYLNTLNNPNASLEQKQFAQQMLDQLGAETTEVYGPDGQLVFRTGRGSTGAQKDPQPSSLSSALLDIKGLQRGFNPDKPSVGWIATAKNILGDQILPQVGVTAFSDAQRVAYRQAVKEFKVAYVKALNAPDSRLSDMDRKMLEPLAPNENDSPFEFQEKLNTVERKVRLHQEFNTAFAGKKDPVWTMNLREVLDARKVSPVTDKAAINDELAAFALQESHGLRGRTKEQLVEEAGNLWKEKKITKDELAFWLKSVLGR